MILAPVRCVQGAPVTVTFTSVDADGEPSATDPGVVTVGVERADGSTVVAAGAATSGSGATRTYALTASHTANLDQLTVTWTASAVTIGTTVVDVVGNVYAPLADIRDTEPTLGSTIETLSANLLRARAEVEALVERAVGHVLAFVPRFSVAHVRHRGNVPYLTVPHYFVRQVRWVQYVDGSGTHDVSLDNGVHIDGRSIYLTSGWWPCGQLLVGYEHGMDAPPADLKRQAILQIRRQHNQSNNGIDPRATSFQPVDGGTILLATPGIGPWTTGVPAIDEVLNSYRSRYPSAAVA